MKALGHMVSEKKIVLCFYNCKSKRAIGWGHFLPQGHAWQDLCKAPCNNVAYQI